MKVQKLDTKLYNKTFIKYIIPGVSFGHTEIVRRLRKDGLYVSEDSLSTRMRKKVGQGLAVKVNDDKSLAEPGESRKPRWLVSKANMSVMIKAEQMELAKRAQHKKKKRKKVEPVINKGDELWVKMISMPIV
jgi:hypothetical protein